MASNTESDTRYWRITPVARVLAPQSAGTVRQWLHVWRWPAGLVAGLVLWLALVAVVGAATRRDSPVCRPADCSEVAAFTRTTIIHMS